MVWLFYLGIEEQPKQVYSKSGESFEYSLYSYLISAHNTVKPL